MNRRRFLTLGAVASGTFAVGGLSRVTGGPVAAAASAPPTVDRLVLTNVVDNLYDVFARGGRLDTVTVERTPLGKTPLLAEHGLAYHIDSSRGGERRQILLDFSLTDWSLFNNYRALGIDPYAADALVLSHGHMDHYGALPALATAGQGKWKPGVTVYAGGEDTFCHRVVVTPAATIDQGRLDRPGLEAKGLKVHLASQPGVVAGQAFTSGQIARLTDFEKPPAAARLRAGDAGSACSAIHFGLVKVETKPGDLVADNFQGEHATAFLVKDRGLVVITSCGHAGVINSVRQVQKATGIEKVHAVVGGFHLAPAPEEVVAKTVAAFKAINPDYHPPGPLLGDQHDHGGAPGAAGQADHALDGYPGGLRGLGPRGAAKFDSAARRRLGSSTEGAMKTLSLAVLMLLASAGIAPAQTKSPGPLDLEYKQRAPAHRPVPPRKLEEDTAQAVRELDRQRTDRMLRDVQPGPSRRPDLDRDVTQGIQSRGLGR